MTTGSNVGEPPLPAVPATPPSLPETKLDLSLSFDNILGDLQLDNAGIDPK